MSLPTQGNLATFLQALGLEIRRQRLWMALVAGVLLTVTVLGNLSMNVARTELMERLNQVSAPSSVPVVVDPVAPATPKALAAYTARLEGFESAPEEEQALRQALEKQGLRLTTDPHVPAVVLRRTESTDTLQISATSSADLVETLATFRMALELDEKSRIKAVLDQDPRFQRAPALQADPQQVKEQLQQLTQTAPLVLRLLLATAIVLMMTFIASASLGLEWDLRRAASNLEPWALTPRPTWILYGSQLAPRCIMSALAVLTCAFPTFLLTPEISAAWAVIATGVLLVFCLGLSVLVGMWGLLSTMLFHHRYGRMLGRLLLSPISLGALTMFRLSLAVEAVSSFGQWMQGRLPQQSWWVIAGSVTTTGLVLLGLGLALTPLINARIGQRRQGLRKL